MRSHLRFELSRGTSFDIRRTSECIVMYFLVCMPAHMIPGFHKQRLVVSGVSALGSREVICPKPYLFLLGEILCDLVICGVHNALLVSQLHVHEVLCALVHFKYL